MRILIAEDERITRRSLQKQLEGWNHDVVAADDGAVAWDQFQRQPFDIVVTDWDMPRMDGRELIQRIRRSGQSGYTYLIMLTGRSEKADLVAGMDAGADDFLAKPFDKNELRVRLNAGERIIELERRLASRNELLRSANDRMKADLDAAARSQRDLLPQSLPDALAASFAWYYEPCDELGGDTLNVLPLHDGIVVIYLLDVSGHGVPAALLSVTLNRVLSALDPGSSILFRGETEAGPRAVRPPRVVAEHLNRQFPMTAQSGKYFTMVYGVLDTKTGLLRYVLAGHPAPILLRKGQDPQALEGNGFPIGMIEGAEFDEYEIQLEPGDRLYFYSDGITEAVNSRNEMLDMEGLIRLIERNQPSSSEEDLVKCVEDLKHWCGSVPLKDDISLLALEIPPAR